MAHHCKSRRRPSLSHRRRNRNKSKNYKRTHRRHHKRTASRRTRRYKSRGGNGLDGYAPANYSPTGTINPAVMVPPNYIRLNPDVSAIPFGVSTTNPPLPPPSAALL